MTEPRSSRDRYVRQQQRRRVLQAERTGRRVVGMTPLVAPAPPLVHQRGPVMPGPVVPGVVPGPVVPPPVVRARAIPEGPHPPAGAPSPPTLVPVSEEARSTQRIAPPGPPTGAPPGPPPRIVLVARSGIEQGRTFELRPGDSTVGRGPECDVRLQDETVSRRHALLHIDAERATIQDLGSSNGTIVYGTKITEPTEVEPGDEIKLGAVRLLLDVVGPVWRPDIGVDQTATMRNPPKGHWRLFGREH